MRKIKIKKEKNQKKVSKRFHVMAVALALLHFHLPTEPCFSFVLSFFSLWHCFSQVAITKLEQAMASADADLALQLLHFDQSRTLNLE